VTAKLFVVTMLLASALIVSTITPAMAAQLDTRINPNEPTSDFTIKFLRTIFIEYNEGGELADDLRKAKQWTLQKSAGPDNPGVAELTKRINEKILVDGSTAKVSDLSVDYIATLTARGIHTSIDYKVVLSGKIGDYVLREYSGVSPALIDIAWRGIAVEGPVVIDGVEINQPLSALKIKMPTVASKLAGTEAVQVLTIPIINANGIRDQPLGNWHFLFDPTGINVDAATFGLAEEISGFVVSSFTMGESSFREGIVGEKVWEATFTLDKQYTIRAIESGDSANVHVIGFAAVDELTGAEVFGVSPTAPEGYATTSTGEFPIMIVYGMAGMAGIGAIGFFIFSSKQLKKEANQGQTGIDPSQLRGFQTSASSGGYQTNRGEAQLIDDSDYTKSKSVYDEQKQDEPATGASSKGSMPKGWKP